MPAQDPQGGQKFWFNGVPFAGVENSAADTAGVKFWFNGVPTPAMFPAGGPQIIPVGQATEGDGGA